MPGQNYLSFVIVDFLITSLSVASILLCRHYLYIHQGPFFLYGITLISAWINNHKPSKIWDQITYLFPKCNAYTIEICEWISNSPHILHMYDVIIDRGRDKMATIFQTTFSNAFSWMKIYQFRLRFHWGLFLGVQLTIFQHWFIQWLGAVKATSHYLNQWWLVYRRIYASLGLNELKLSHVTKRRI